MSGADAVVRARIDLATKQEATMLFKKMGITVSDAIRMMLVQAVAEKALPFEVRVPNAETAAALLDSRNGVVTRAASVDDLFADDREIGHFDICEILDAYDFGTVAEIEHVAVIATTFEAQLPPADDSETDDLFEVCEHTREAAEAKVAAEISRRATLAEIKGESQ